ncbi:unnamed protein product, partial [Symbiodinium pilosum]
SLDVHLADLMGDEAERAPRLARRRWHNRVLRQLLTYEPEILCLQQVQADITAPVAKAEFCQGTGEAAGQKMVASQGRPTLSEGTMLAALVPRLESQ